MSFNHKLNKIFQTFPFLKQCDVFFETGLRDGRGVDCAVKHQFKSIYSIEVSPYWYNLGVEKYNDMPHVNLILDDSINIGNHLDSIDQQILFWLDAHNDGSNVLKTPLNKKGQYNCPLYHELNAISNHKIKNHMIIIDDVRIIKKNNKYITSSKGLKFENWGKDVNISQLTKLLKSINPNYNIKFHGDQIIAYI